MAEETKSTPLPKHLYKYRSWSDPLHRRIITHSEIRFASPRWFNDPFDCRVLIGTRGVSRDELVQTLNESFRHTDVAKKGSASTQSAEYLADKVMDLSDTDYEKFMLRMRRFYDSITGIFTTSSVPDDILMWSHYSDSHKGFCVELDSEKLVTAVNNLPVEDNPTIKPLEVEYPDDYPTLLPLPGKNLEYWMKQYSVKSSRWEYEKEFRLITMDGTDFSVSIEPSIITKVTLGCEMSSSDQEEIIHELFKQGGTIALEKAKKRDDEFGLEFVPIDY